MPDNGWWYYMMGQESAKGRSGRGRGGFGVSVLNVALVIIFLIMLGILVAVGVWYFS